MHSAELRVGLPFSSFTGLPSADCLYLHSRRAIEPHTHAWVRTHSSSSSFSTRFRFRFSRAIRSYATAFARCVHSLPIVDPCECVFTIYFVFASSFSFTAQFEDVNHIKLAIKYTYFLHKLVIWSWFQPSIRERRAPMCNVSVCVCSCSA